MEDRNKTPAPKKSPPKALPVRAECPFCGLPLERPNDLPAHRPREMPVGYCACGAVYAYDATGHNLGAAFAEALVFACNMDWDLAWGLLPEEDYQEKIVEKYDYTTNCIVPGGFIEGRKAGGALYFVRLHEDIREVTEEGVRRRLATAKTAVSSTAAPDKTGPALTKEEVERLVDAYEAAPLLSAAGRDPGVLGKLQRLLYSADAQKRRRAAEFLGRAGAVAAAENPRAVARLLQTLFSSLEDTGSSGWGTIEAIGEVIAATVGTFAGYVPVLYQVLEDRAQEEDTPSRVLHALGRIAGESPALITRPFSSFTRYLSDPRPAVRGQAVFLLGNLNPERAKETTAHLAADAGELDFYEKGEIVKKTVGELVARLLEKEDPPRPR